MMWLTRQVRVDEIDAHWFGEMLGLCMRVWWGWQVW